MKYVTSTVALCAALIGGSAFAADLPTHKAAPAPYIAPQAGFSWTGFYFGVNGGYTFSNGGATNTTGSPAFAAMGPAMVPGTLSTNGGGFLVGGQLGYNYQSGVFVGGLETDLDYVDQHKSASFTGFANPALGNFTTTASHGLDYLGTVRARVGVTPFDRALLYVTGGLAYGGVKESGSVTASATPSLNWSGSLDDTRFGYALGGGGEYAFTRNISLKIEYLYYDLGRSSFATTGNAAVQATPALNGVYYAGSTRTDGSLVRGGLNFRF